MGRKGFQGQCEFQFRWFQVFVLFFKVEAVDFNELHKGLSGFIIHGFLILSLGHVVFLRNEVTNQLALGGGPLEVLLLLWGKQ